MITLRTDLTRIQRTNLETCITVHMHQKESTEGLLRKKVWRGCTRVVCNSAVNKHSVWPCHIYTGLGATRLSPQQCCGQPCSSVCGMHMATCML